MSHPRTSLLFLAASAFSLTGLLAALANPPLPQPVSSDPGLAITAPPLGRDDSSRAGKPAQDRKRQAAEESFRSTLGFVEIVDPAPPTPVRSTASSTASPTGGMLLLSQPDPKDQKEPQKEPAVQPQPQPPPTPGADATGASTFSKTLSGFGVNQNKAWQGFNPSTTPQSASAGAVSVEPTPGSAPGAAGALESNGAMGVDLQRRSPLVIDPRIEGFHFGQIGTYADGAYWFPARVDLDTVISKLGSDNILSVLVIKGPYSVRYGPGFSFLDIETVSTPRFKDGCFDAHGSTSFGFRSNGRGWQGQQAVWGGNADWGFRLSYDLQAAQDYSTGNGTRLPTAYNNQFVDFAYGLDLDKNATMEVRYFHNQQTNVFIPGLLTDVVGLSTDAFTGRLVLKEGNWYDRLTIDTWVNTTTFNGGSGNQATRNQIPQLDAIFPASDPRNNAINNTFGPVRLDMLTDGYALSYGLREITTWGDPKCFNLSIGADIRVFSNFYNEFDAFNFSVANGSVGSHANPANLGIPYGRQIDPGLLIDSSIPIGQSLVLKAGARVDFTTTQFIQFGPNVDPNVYVSQVGVPHDVPFTLFSGFISSDYKLTDQVTLQSGYGYAQRPPTLTELYAGGAFLGLVQNGFNSIFGNPQLAKEQIHQIDLGMKAKYDEFRAGASVFYAWLPDYITFDNLGPFTLKEAQQFGFNKVQGVGNPATPINRLRFKNTGLAIMAGFNVYAEVDVQPWLAVFGVVNYVGGNDTTIGEALPGIAPLDSRVGFRIHDPGKTPRWGFEYYARAVAVQAFYAESLFEQRTGGFTVHNVRAYWQVRENCMVLASIENIGNLQYREHLDLRTGNGVFQPGISFNFGMKVNY